MRRLIPFMFWTAYLLGKTDLPEMLDFNGLNFKNAIDHAGPNSWKSKVAREAHAGGLGAFNEWPEAGSFFLFLKHEYGIDTVVETGTQGGFTTAFFGNWFEEVHTIELGDWVFQIAHQRLESFPNIHCYEGNSPEVLEKILPDLKEKRVIFYLDAHSNDSSPLLDELKVIAQTHRNRCIIVIDDVELPGRPDFPCDRYQGENCSFAYFRSGLEEVFSEYSSHYLIPKSYSPRAKFLAIPKSWD